MELLLKYKTMYKIRRFEETLLELFSKNKLKGTTHTSIGQEADAVAVMNYVTEKEFVFSNHRCHRHFIAYSDNIKILLAEIIGTGFQEDKLNAMENIKRSYVNIPIRGNC